jgi:transcriptional regulator with XRE-family HTH domain
MTSPGTRIKELRTLSGLSQEELGRRVGVQRAAINKYEKGSVTNIPLSTIEKMAAVFEVSPTYIVGWDDSKMDQLALEVKILQGVSKFYGKDSVELLECYMELSKEGKKRLLMYACDIIKVYPQD